MKDLADMTEGELRSTIRTFMSKIDALEYSLVFTARAFIEKMAQLMGELLQKEPETSLLQEVVSFLLEQQKERPEELHLVIDGALEKLRREAQRSQLVLV